jgi:hypothetical protein
MQEENNLSKCRNCGSELQPGANFCNFCGQKNTDGRLTFAEMVHEFFAALFNLDGKIFRTLQALAVPGKLTSEYFQGRQVSYYHPLRLFIVAGALFVALFSTGIGADDKNFWDGSWQKNLRKYHEHEQERRLAIIQDSLTGQFPQPVAREAMDSLVGRFAGNRPLGKADTLELPMNLELFNGDSIPLKVAEADLFTLSEDSLAAKYGVKDFFSKLFFVQGLRIWKSGKSFFAYLSGNVLWMMFVMMPLLALVLKLLYLRSGFLFYEHLVFSFHTHSLLFILFSILLAFRKMLSEGIWLPALLAVALYLLFSMKRFYGQPWGKTILKFILANALYFFIFIFALLGFFMLSVAFF